VPLLIFASAGPELDDPFFVMAGLDPAIHVFLCCDTVRTWMPGTRPGMTVLFDGCSKLVYCDATLGLP
jgi:hypothetical protein